MASRVTQVRIHKNRRKHDCCGSACPAISGHCSPVRMHLCISFCGRAANLPENRQHCKSQRKLNVACCLWFGLLLLVAIHTTARKTTLLINWPQPYTALLFRFKLFLEIRVVSLSKCMFFGRFTWIQSEGVAITAQVQLLFTVRAINTETHKISIARMSWETLPEFVLMHVWKL